MELYVPKLIPPEPVDLELSEEILKTLGEGLSTVIVPYGHPIFVRMEQIESAMFPETVDLFDIEDRDVMFQFLVLIEDGVAHQAMRLSGPGPLERRTNRLPYFLSDLIGFGDQITEAEVLDHYRSVGIDVFHVTSIETHFRIGPNQQPIGYADLAYLSMLELQDVTGIFGTFAHINEATINSLDRVGISWSYVAGRPDLRTPSIDYAGVRDFDPDYIPVFIGGWHDEDTKAAVEEVLAPFTPPLVFLDLDPVMRDDYFKSEQA